MTPLEILWAALGSGTVVGAVMTFIQRKWSKSDKNDEAHADIAVKEIESKDASEAQLWRQVDSLTKGVSELQNQRIEDWKTFEASRREDADRCFDVSTKLALSEFHRDLLSKENEFLKQEVHKRDNQIKDLGDILKSIELRLAVAESKINYPKQPLAEQ